MALRVIMLRKQMSDAQARLDALRSTQQGFAAREAELETAIGEANTEEERRAVEEQVTAFETDQRENSEAITAAEEEIRGIESKIAEAEAAAAAARGRQTGAPAAPEREERGGMPNTNTTEQRTRFFGMTIQQRDAFVKRQDIQDFLTRVREFAAQKRGVSGAELGIPIVILDLLRDNMTQYSKLTGYVALKQVKGYARQNVMGTIPEGIWTEAVNATLNELSLSFSQVEMDGYRVGGYIVIDNAYLEDDDNLGLLTEITSALGKAIGYALDKAIVYGTGSKMPVGFMTRLAAASKPAWWGDKQAAFTNLSTSHLLKLDLAAATGEEFFAGLIIALGKANPKYSNGQAVWLMSRATHIALEAKALAFNSSAALVAGVNNTMPIVGGSIIELDFIPDNDILGGFLSLYLLVERAGAVLGSSDIPLYLQEKTIFKGSARYDGKPVIGEGFVGVNIANTAVTTSVSFAEDTANTPDESVGS